MFSKAPEKKRSQFPIFQSHLDWAHDLWKRTVHPDECVIDATCGNGHDTLMLAQISQGFVYAIDIQEQAIENTRFLLQNNVSEEIFQRIRFVQGCHTQFSQELETKEVALIVYNLGYLPGGKKELTTCAETTLVSIQKGMKLIKEGGCISITCYPGHPEGEREEEEILRLCSKLDPRTWSCCHHRWTNRKQSPSLFWIQKSLGSVHQ